MRTVLIVSIIAFATATIAVAGSRGNGHLVTQGRDARGFTRVELRGPLDATVREGADFQVKVTVDEDLQPAVVTELRGNTLVVRCVRDMSLRNGSGVEISLPDLEAVSTAGSGDVSVTGSRRRDLALASTGSGDISYRGPASKLRVGSTGSGDVAVDVSGEMEEVEVGVKGSGDVTLEGGRARDLVAVVAGSGNIDAEALTARSARLATSGSGDIEVTLDGGDASFAVAGSGDITWHGTANVTSQASAGSGEIHHR